MLCENYVYITLDKIEEEVLAQKEKWGEQKHPSFSNDVDLLFKPADEARDMCEAAAKEGSLSWSDILYEEICEAMEETKDQDKLETELIQCAAVIVSWIECLRRNEDA